jgi:hypothetical protein
VVFLKRAVLIMKVLAPLYSKDDSQREYEIINKRQAT